MRSIQIAILLAVFARRAYADDSSRHTRRIITVVTGSVGIAGVAVGVAHGIGAYQDWHEVLDRHLCDAEHVCNPDGVRLSDRSRGLARGADILIASGLLVTGAAVVLWVTAQEVKPEPHTTCVVPTVTPTLVGAAVMAWF
jgi:hypothetical protein